MVNFQNIILKAHVLSMFVKLQLHVSEKIFEYFVLEKLPFMSPWQPIKLSYLDKFHMKRRGLLT